MSIPIVTINGLCSKRQDVLDCLRVNLHIPSWSWGIKSCFPIVTFPILRCATGFLMVVSRFSSAWGIMKTGARSLPNLGCSNIDNWWVGQGHPSEKYEFVNWDDYIWLFPIYGKITLMFQTTNQIKLLVAIQEVATDDSLNMAFLCDLQIIRGLFLASLKNHRCYCYPWNNAGWTFEVHVMTRCHYLEDHPTALGSSWWSSLSPKDWLIQHWNKWVLITPRAPNQLWSVGWSSK